MHTRILTVMTYNIHKGFGMGKMRFVLPSIRTALSELNPDMLFLQEVQGQHRIKAKRIKQWPTASQTQYLAEQLGPHYVYAKQAEYFSGHHGNAILSKYPLLDSKTKSLSPFARVSRGFIHNRIQLATHPHTIHLLCVHLGIFKQEQIEQCETLIQWILNEVPDNAPLILAGDFNDWRNHLTPLLQEKLHIEEAFLNQTGEHAKSFPAIRPTLQVDRIYYRGLTLTEVRCLNGKPWQTLSDHLPLFASFLLS